MHLSKKEALKNFNKAKRISKVSKDIQIYFKNLCYQFEIIMETTEIYIKEGNIFEALKKYNIFLADEKFVKIIKWKEIVEANKYLTITTLVKK